MTLNKFVVVGIFSFFSSQAHAAKYCADPAVLANKVQDCEDNEYFSEAAVECLEKFEKSLEVAKGNMSAGLGGNASRSKNSQSGKQRNSKQDYDLSRATLDSLIAEATAAQKETAAYYDSVAFPEDADEPQITGPDLDAFLNSDPCYKDNRDVIGSVLRDFDNYLVQLKTARDAAAALEAGTSSRETALDSVGLGAVSNTGGEKGGPSALPNKKKKSNHGSSDITGIEQDKAKRQKK